MNRSGLLCRKESVEAVKINCPSGASFSEMCGKIGVINVPMSSSQDSVVAVKKLSFRSEFLKGCVNSLGFLESPVSHARRVSRQPKLCVRSC